MRLLKNNSELQPPKKKPSRRLMKEYIAGYAFILPLVIGLGGFYFYGLVKVIIDSFYNVGAFNVSSFAGISNYVKMWEDPDVWRSLGNTIKYVLIIAPCMIIFSLVLANFLNMKIKGRTFFRTVYFIPSITMSAAVAMVWKWLYNGDYGLINAIFGVFGLGPFNYLSQTNNFPIICISIVQIWMSAGYNMIILLGGMQNISKTYYEAAAIDGAGEVKKFFSITIPMISPTLFFVMMMTIINTFQTFDIIYLMIERISPAVPYTDSLIVYFYRNAFMYSKKGYASAIAVLLFVIIMIISMIQMKLQKKWVIYD